MGTSSLNGIFARTDVRSDSVAAAFETTRGACRTGVRSGGGVATVPWNVWPTTTTTIALFARYRIGPSIGFTSEGAKSLATAVAAACAPPTRAS